MVIVDSKTGKAWDQGNVRFKGQLVRAQCLADLAARDTVRGVDPPGSVYEVVNPRTGETRLNIDKVRAMHTGDDEQSLFAKRMAEFAAVPQDESAFIAESVKAEQQRRLAEASKAGNAVEESLAVLKGGGKDGDQLRDRGRPAGAVRER